MKKSKILSIVKKYRLYLNITLTTFVVFAIGSLFAKYYSIYFKKLVSKDMYINGNCSWLQLNPWPVRKHPTRYLGGFSAGGIEGYVGGSFEALLSLDKMETKKINSYTIKDESDDKKIDFNVELPADLKISKSSKDKVCCNFIKIETGSGIVYQSINQYGTQSDTSFFKESTPYRTNNFPAEFRLNKNNTVTCAFIKRKVNKNYLGSLPSDFFAWHPYAMSMAGPGQSIARDSAFTAILTFEKNEELDDEERPQIIMNSNTLFSKISSGEIQIGNSTRSGDLSINLEDLTHTLSLYFSKNKDKPFDIAISPSFEKDNDESWMMLGGSINYLFFTGPNFILRIGTEKFNLGTSDFVELEGYFFINLSFQPGSIPKLTVDGTARSCKINNLQILNTRWEQINPDVQGGIVGGFIGALLGLISSVTVQLLYKRRLNLNNSISSNKT